MHLHPVMKAVDFSRPVVVGVSGGADSLCLLGLLHDAGWNIVAAHLNHGLRPEAQADADHARMMSEQLGVPFVLQFVGVAEYAKDHGLSIEEAARKCRYRFLFDTARSVDAQAVAVAHTADDQIETVLMHLIRGAGLSGLKGMTPSTILPEFDDLLPLIRPILHLWRIDTEEYCRNTRLEFVVDASNTDQTYFRNRLRHSLIPELETYNPQVKRVIFNMALSLQDDYSILRDQTNRIWNDLLLDEGKGYVSFSFPALAAIPAGMQRNIYRRAMQQLRPGLRDINHDALDLAVGFTQKESEITKKGTSRKVDLVGGLYIYKENEKLYLAQYEADLPAAEWPQVLAVGSVKIGDTMLGNGWQLILEEVVGEDLLEMAEENDDPYSAWIDGEKISDPLLIRPVADGDSFQPLGMNGQTVKLSDYFINRKLPKRSRGRWPLLISGDQIVWVMGLRLAHPFRVENSTRKALHLILKRLP